MTLARWVSIVDLANADRSRALHLMRIVTRTSTPICVSINERCLSTLLRVVARLCHARRSFALRMHLAINRSSTSRR